VDAGHGWLIFALPPAEAAFHPSENDVHELYFLCDDLKTEMASLAKKDVSAPRSRKHDEVPLQRCGFPVEERSAFINRNIPRPWA
jgi:hypothetical protein